MASCNEEMTSCQDKSKISSLESDTCLEPPSIDSDYTKAPININSVSDDSGHTEARCDVDLQRSQMNKKRKWQKNAQRDLGDTSSIKNSAKDGLLLVEDKNIETYQREETLTTYCNERGKSRNSLESSVEPIMSEGNMPLDHSNEVYSFKLSESKLETVQDEQHAASVKVVENGEFASMENKEMTQKKRDVDLDVPIVEENVLQVSNFSIKGPCIGCANKKLLILDVNGLLADIIPYIPHRYRADIIISKKSVFRRPFCEDFLRFCFEKFNVGVWSSRTRRNMDMVIDFLFGDSRHNLLFCWDQSHCTDTGFTTVENRNKPLLLKELKKLWTNLKLDLSNNGEFDESNTLLLDDSPYKALRNPVHTAIFPYSYRYYDLRDFSLGPGGDLRVYLERLADAQNVQEHVAQNPFGQRAITESNPSWAFYRKIIAADSCQSQDVASTSVNNDLTLKNDLPSTFPC